MADLTKEISDLKAELEGYRVDLKNATSPEEKIMYGGLIKSRGDNLTELLKQQTEWSKVSVAPKGTPAVDCTNLKSALLSAAVKDGFLCLAGSE
eukprot:scaffold550_cov136-Ochromonas_danica.AAC.1